MNDARQKEIQRAQMLIIEAKDILEVAATQERDDFDNMPEDLQNDDAGERAEEVVEGHDCVHYRGVGTHWRLVGSSGQAIEVRAASRLRSNSGLIALDWALAGCGLVMNSWVDVEPDLRAGRLVHVLPEWRSDPAPVCALYPSSRQLPSRVRLFIDGIADWLNKRAGRYVASVQSQI
jgi:DNA-binding transcriptional LysR family regulator